MQHYAIQHRDENGMWHTEVEWLYESVDEAKLTIREHCTENAMCETSYRVIPMPSPADKQTATTT
jgi:hypothetical protein